MVVPTMGTVIMCFLASSTPLRMASGTSPALPRPAPTRPWPSPTTTSALKEKRRPPLTTLATRFSETIFSCRSPPRSSRRSMRIPISEPQTTLASRLCERAHSAVIQISAAIEDHLIDTDGTRTFGDRLAHHGCCGDGEPRTSCAFAQIRLGRGGGRERASRGVVDQLRLYVAQAAKHRQARSAGGARHVLADAAMTAVARGPAIVPRVHFVLPALPDLPALRRTCSPL